MAESFAFGIADRVVGKLTSLAVQEISLAWGVESQVEELRDTMSTIRAVLLDAEKKQVKDHRLSIWLRKLKDEFYEAEDVVDEVEYEALRQTGGTWDEVCDFFSTSNPLASRLRIAHKMKNIAKRLDKIAAEKSQFELTQRFGDLTILHRERETTQTHSFVRASDVIGRRVDKENIVQVLMQSNDGPENVSVIAIVGIGGLGKTTLAQLVYNDDRVVSRFQNRMWVCVSEDFGIQRLTKEILTSLMDERCDHLSMDNLQNRLRNKLDGKTFLLILDDVWNTDRDKWLQLKALTMGGAMGSKIVVTTRSKSVASIMGGTSPAYELRGLSHDECLSLLTKCAFRNGEDQRYPNLVAIGKDIIKKCGGVPLAVRTLGGLLYLKTDECDWVSVRDNEIWELEQKEDDILPALKLSYDELPFDLKQCFAFCSLFPKDYKFSNLEVIQMWMTQGLIPMSSQNEELEDIGNRYINELLLRCFFQDVVEEIQRVWYYFKMHDLVHDLALSVARPECSMINFHTRKVSERVRHISIVDTHWPDEEEDILRFKGKVRNIRTIWSPMVEAGPKSKSIVATCFRRFEHMRVLDLTNSSLVVLPNSISSLKHLRYLNLSNNDKMKKLPNSICKLHLLQILLLDGCVSLEELPRDIGKMMSLRHLEVTTKEISVLGYSNGKLMEDRGYFNSLRLLCIRQCNYMESLMKGLQSLTALRTLVIADCSGRASLSVELTALETLLICNCANLDLSYGFRGLGRLQVFGIWELPYLVTLPHWLLQGPSSNTLRHLLIHDCGYFRALSEEDGPLNLTFLETLIIEECPAFSALPEGMRHLTALRRLDIRFCPRFSALPEAIRHLSSLTQLKIVGCNKILTQRCQPGIGEDWNKIAHVLDIYLDGTRISGTNYHQVILIGFCNWVCCCMLFIHKFYFFLLICFFLRSYLQNENLFQL